MVDFVQKMHVFETVIFDTFDFGTPSSPKQVIDPSKPIYFWKVLGCGISNEKILAFTFYHISQK